MKSNSRIINGSSQISKKGASNMAKSASQYKARTNFLLEHLASSTIRTSQDAQKSAKERLSETKELLAKGNLWTKEMEMRLTDNDVVLLDGETQDVIEVYPLSSINVVEHLSDDLDLNSVLLFTTQQTENKYAATHLFQSDRVPAAVVATEIMKAASSKQAMPSRLQANKNGPLLPPPPSYAAPQPPSLDKERMDLYERSLVAQTIAAFSAQSNENLSRPGKTPKFSQGEGDGVEESVPLDVLEARTNRDVQILNHCIDDIENLVWRTKKSAEAWKKLQKKKGKIKPDNLLAMEARPPPESDFIDAFQKFKYAFNLLGRLRPHIHNPNAAELIHYLFVPLSLLVRCTNGPEKARSVVSPLLSTQAVELLQNCLSSKEMELWSALGPNWTETKHSKHFKDQFIPPYAPVFKDGWVPPEYVGSKDIPANISAAVAANAAAVAQMNDQQKRTDDSEPTSPTVLTAAAKFRRLASKQDSNHYSAAPSKAIFRRSYIQYDFTARNSKELSVKQGDEVAILDDSRKWWCVRNSDGEIGFIPNTIIESKGVENQGNTATSSVTTQASYLPSPPSTAPPPIPSISVTDIQIKKAETTETSSVNLENRKVPFVELRHVSVNKNEEDIGPKPPPPPPMSPPPPTPPPSTATVTATKVTVNRTENSEQPPSDFQKAILNGGNLKKVNKEAIQKKKEEEKEKRMSSADMLTDELKRRMTHGALTPHVVHKTEQIEPVVLNPDSGTHEVRDWLKSKNFSQACVQALAWKSAKDLEKMSKDELKRTCGGAEGARVYSQFAVLCSQWKTMSKGNELQFIMQRRKEMVDVTTPKDPTEEGKLRNIVAEARAAELEGVNIETEGVKRNSYSGKKPVMVAIPQERPHPQNMVIEAKVKPERPRSDSNKIPPPTRRKSRGLSFGSEQFIPPPPADYNDKDIAMTPEQIDAILKEQKKQQELLMEHEKQFALLERLNIQKKELEEHKREYEEHQMRQRQAELEERQKELEKQIKAQQAEMQANQSRILQQNSYMTGMTGMSNMMMPQRQIPMMTPQVQMIPVSGMPSQPAYMSVAPMAQGMQPMMGYTHGLPQGTIPQMVPFNPTIHQ